MPDTPLRPDEQAAYKTDVQTDAEEPDRHAPDARPWMAIGLVLLAVFIVALFAAVGFGLTR